jgi:hypothetical protein
MSHCIGIFILARTPAIITHIRARLEGSRAQRIVWILEECKDIDYKIEVFKRDKETMLASEELKKIHGMGKSPIIKFQAQGMEPVIIAESGMIVEYLIEYCAPHLMPKRYREGMEGKPGGETEEWMRYRFFMHYAEGSLMTPLVLSLVMVSLGMQYVREGKFMFMFLRTTFEMRQSRSLSRYCAHSHHLHWS